MKSKVPLGTWEQIRQTMAALPLGVDETKLNKKDLAALRALHESAIFATDDQIRSYPNGRLAAQVSLGYVAGEGGKNRGGRH